MSAPIHVGLPLPGKEYIRHVKNHGWTPFRGRLWQRNYCEHIIRTEDALHRIRHYIAAMGAGGQSSGQVWPMAIRYRQST